MPELRETAESCNYNQYSPAPNDNFAGTGAAHQRIQYCGISVRVVRDLAPGDNLRGIGLSQTKPGRNVSGRGMAIAGLVLGIVVGAFWIGLFTWAFIIGFTHTNLPIIGGSSV